ncbi:MAG TPA: hypothetical protein VM142_01330 [Acidimicrobiales bacterium]|nr:hypothetical protein [Acidimicrobiales bacterium]
MLAVDERAFEPLRPTCCSLAVRSETCASGAGPGEVLGNHDVEVDGLSAHQHERVAVRFESLGGVK